MDIIIKNVEILDGLGGRPRPGEIGIKGDTIESVSPPGALRGQAGLEVDGGGKMLCPGFIDMHTHDDAVFWDDVFNEPKLRQGVTTVVTGMCGSSLFPVPENNPELFEDIRREKKWRGSRYPWTARTLEEYVRQLEELSPGINVVPVAGHGAIRLAVMGFDARAPSDAELVQMKGHLEESLEAGAAGMSTGLIYPPGSYARTAELKELAGAAGDCGGLYFTHLRSESEGMEDALAEAVEISRRSGARLHVAHFKCMGRNSWGQAEKRISIMEKALEEGLGVSWDQYPYTAGSTGLVSLLPPRAMENGLASLVEDLGSASFRECLAREMKEEDPAWENFYLQAGGWDRIFVCGAPGCEEFEGASIEEASAKAGKDPFSLVFELLRITRGSASMAVFCMSESDLEGILAHPSTCIGSDGVPSRGKVHPRLYGAFPRVLGLYAVEKGVLTVEEAVRKMTSLPARVLGLGDRGVIREGYKGDMVIFDRKTVRDRASYSDPRRHPEGITHVFVNGRPVVFEEALRDERPGRVLLRR